MFENKIFKVMVFMVAIISAPKHSVAASLEGCSSAPILEKFKEFGKTRKMSPELGEWLGDAGEQRVEPWKPFDNVRFVGLCWVSAWLIETENGYVLIDTLYGPFTNTLIDDLETAGVELSDIKYVLMTHGHFDHVGGALALKEKLPNAKFVMSQSGWKEAAHSAKISKGSHRQWSMIEPEVIVKDGDSLKLGGNTFTAHETPGHSWGTVSYSYDVIDGDNSYRAITVGGLGLNAINGPSQVEAYLSSVATLISMVGNEKQQIRVHLTTHGFAAELHEKRLHHLNRKAGAPNLFVDANALLKILEGLRDDALARLKIERNKTSKSLSN